MNSAKEILVTGATGFIGRHVVKSLQEAGYAVTRGVRRFDNSTDATEVAVDLERPETILALRADYRFDAVVHLGAYVGFSGTSEASMYMPNVLATGLLAATARDWDAHLIFASAAIVCGSRRERIDDTTQAYPDTSYIGTKYLGELLNAASGARHCNLRIGGVFGASGPWHLGLNRAIDGALSGEVPTQVGSGTALRNYIYVKDAADAITFSLRNDICGTHLLAGKEVSSIGQMLKDICRVFLDDESPILEEGPDGKNQIIETSRVLPEGRTFLDALIDIRDFRQ